MKDHKMAGTSAGGAKSSVGSSILSVFRRKKDESTSSSSTVGGESLGHDSSSEAMSTRAPLNLFDLEQEKSDYTFAPTTTSTTPGSVLGPRMGAAEFSSSVRQVQASPNGGEKAIRLRDSSKLNINLTL
mmetsp:Transcript_13920/g.30425  ORF Transcript_13920/g.30425 Transcript_13920/m.30425 type:complete len:129 (+) Transcript_13920:61-447(+)|eukprot:CAMPEP_0168782670 /NCGR_PEP_ID=MMETSP0725-20121227/9286_1 /TAXON_ID=265536 /ORGANISM="Amphiprora sp., Strain CCMP467" /LENGTH=128 /DNA_ID=CAMNT_0008832615 /DNA_START=128 /DNA_END=514 /DNA_ORIENTATION=-